MTNVDKTGKNTTRYKDMFSAMTDKKFDNYMIALRDGKTNLFMYFGNITDKVTMNELIAIAKKRKIKLFERLNMYDPDLGRQYKTKHEFMVLTCSIRRLSQYIAHKISLPESDTKVNPTTGQVIPPDKGAKISMIETSILVSKGLDKSAVELLKIRGGDITAYQAAKLQIEESGSANFEELPLENRPRSVVTANIFLASLGVEANL